MDNQSNINVAEGLYADQALNEKVNTQVSSNKNALASLFQGAKQLSDDFLFAIGIKLAAIDNNQFDLTDISTLVQSAQALGYTVEVEPNAKS